MNCATCSADPALPDVAEGAAQPDPPGGRAGGPGRVALSGGLRRPAAALPQRPFLSRLGFDKRRALRACEQALGTRAVAVGWPASC